VLTFAYQIEPAAHADIVICLPVIEKEARAAGIALRDHLAHLVIHGVLHAQGYDHVEDADAHRMEARESQILARFAVPDPYRT
jgi:probable rRNA maturation factor